MKGGTAEGRALRNTVARLHERRLPWSSQLAIRNLILATLIALPLSAQTRLSSDFEIAQMERQLVQSRGFEAQLSGRLNLGDARAARNEISLARAEYAKALELAEGERLDARRESDLTRYANATGYAALAQAKLGRKADAFALLEETLRYASDDAENWNLYSSAMRLLGHPRKAVSAARNAVDIASRKTNRLDLAVYRYALGTALIDAGEHAEAERLLATLAAALRSREFDALRREVARLESFQIYSSARGDVAAYVSLLNRAQLRLASLYERRGDIDLAREQYDRVLEARSDDVTALAAFARLARSDQERARRYAEAFDANPFSMPLVREYQKYLSTLPSLPSPGESEGTEPGSAMRSALIALEQRDTRKARGILDVLLARFPANETLRALRREAESVAAVVLPDANPSAAELAALLDGFERLTAEQRAALDQATFTSVARFEGTVFESGPSTSLTAGMIDGLPFRFPQPTLFAGRFDITGPLRLTYRILGVTRGADHDALLLEPLRIEAVGPQAALRPRDGGQPTLRSKGSL